MPRLNQKRLPATFNARGGGKLIVNRTRDRRRITIAIADNQGNTAGITLSPYEARKIDAQLSREAERIIWEKAREAEEVA